MREQVLELCVVLLVGHLVAERCHALEPVVEPQLTVAAAKATVHEAKVLQHAPALYHRAILLQCDGAIATNVHRVE